jgi:hypothetical protein
MCLYFRCRDLAGCFAAKLYSLLKLTRSQNLETDGKYKLVYINQSATAFSFFNYLFIGTKVQGSETIIRHELVHIRQKHSADIIFIELLKIVNWFNPFIYLLQYSLKTIHEYIADEKTAIAENDALAYSSFLVNNAYGLGGSSITHSFFNYNLLKKRIIMLHQKRSGSLARLKYLVAVPICAGLLCASTLAFSKDYGWVNVGPHRIDKNNHSPQVLEPARHLLIRQHGLSYVADKFSSKRADGSIRVYTPYNISNKDVVDLAKKNIQLTVIYDEDTTKTHIAPPPPPAPPAASVDRRPPPPPPAPPFRYTTKGYKYKEDGYLINGKTNFRVIIVTKSGREIAYFKNTASADVIKLLKNKYGYTFPDMNISNKMPPPPPVAPVASKSVAAPKAKTSLIAPIAPIKAVPVSEWKGVVFTPKGDVAADMNPVVVVNGEVKDFDLHLQKGQRLVVNAADSVHAVMYTNNDLKTAIKKYGNNARNGVIFAYGKTSVTVSAGATLPKPKVFKAVPAKVTALQIDSDALGRMGFIAVVRKKGC